MWSVRLKFCWPRAGILWLLVWADVGPVAKGTAEAMQSLPSRQMKMAESDSAAIWNNLANTYLERTDEDSAAFDTAIVFYQRAIALAPEDPGIKLNFSIAYLMKDDTTNADSLFWMGYMQAGSSIERVYSLLGMKYERSAKDKGTARNLTEADLQEWMNDTVVKRSTRSGGAKAGGSQLQDKEKKSPPSGKSKSSQDKKKPTRSGGKKSLDPDEIKNYLYWRF
jgi:hypothetical protein